MKIFHFRDGETQLSLLINKLMKNLKGKYQTEEHYHTALYHEM
jgi:hypothetical protein